MLVDCGCRYVIIGHSSGVTSWENNFMIRKKLAMALENGLKPILCVGETLQERENQLAMQVVEEQLKEALNGLKFSAEQLVIAYEPVWAIGTGINASCNDAQQMCRLVRRVLERADRNRDGVRILYGRSVNADNIAMFLVQPDIDGALVRASWKQLRLPL